MLQEHLSSDGDDEGGVIGALVDVIVLLDDLLDAGDWNYMLGLLVKSYASDGTVARSEKLVFRTTYEARRPGR